MAEDIAPALLEKVKETFERLMNADSELLEKITSVRNGSTNYTDAFDYADRVGQMLRQALAIELTPDALPDNTLYYNIAKRLVEQIFGEAYDLGQNAAKQVQKEINRAAGLQLQAVEDKAKRKDRLAGLIEAASGRQVGATGWAEFLVNVSELPQGAVSDTLEENATFQGKSGLHPKIIRKSSGKCCKWCARLTGTYSYPVENQDVYKRHSNCRCTVEYDPNTGIRQNAHTKQWTDTRTGRIIKSKYAPSAQRQTKGLKTSPKKYAKLCSIMNTQYPNLTPEDGARTIRDSSYGYIIKADGFGGLILLKKFKL